MKRFKKFLKAIFYTGYVCVFAFCILIIADVLYPEQWFDGAVYDFIIKCLP